MQVHFVISYGIGKNTDKEGTTLEGHQRSGVFIRIVMVSGERTGQGNVSPKCNWTAAIVTNLVQHIFTGYADRWGA